MAGWAAGSYAISFDAAQRGNAGKSVEDFEVLVDGYVVGTFKPTGTSYQTYTTAAFTVTAGAHTIEFLGLDTAGGDNTAFLDAVAVATASPRAPPSVGDSGFEAVQVGAGKLRLRPDRLGLDLRRHGWHLRQRLGLHLGQPRCPPGRRRSPSSRTRAVHAVSGRLGGGIYTISFDAAQRGNAGKSVEDFEVLVDGKVVGTFKPTGTSYQTYTTATFTVTAGAHTIEFLGLDTAGGDNTAFLDDVAVASATV